MPSKQLQKKNSLGIVLDKSSNMSVIFLDKRYDYTDKVLDQLLKGPSKEDAKSKDAKAKNKK